MLIVIGLALCAPSARAVVNALRELDKTIQATRQMPELGKVAQTLERIDQRWKAISDSLSEISFSQQSRERRLARYS
jgi:hypothetical protein